MNNVVTVDFHGSKIYGLRHTGVVYIAVKPIVDAMGLSWGSQLNRLRRDPILSKGIFKMNIPLGAGGPQEYVCLQLNRVAGWLFTISSNQIKAPEVRAKVLLFQEECYDVLNAHFSANQDGPVAKVESRLAREQNDAYALSLRMVTEARHIWGNRSAADLWEKLKLPKVAAMDDVFRQFDLFGQASLVPHNQAA